MKFAQPNRHGWLKDNTLLPFC